MNEIVNLLKGVVLLDEKAYQSFLASENMMRRGIFILLACFLVAAIPAAVGDLVNNVQQFTPEKAQEFQDQFFQGFETAQQFMPQDEDFQFFMDQFKENFAYGLNIGVAIDALPRPLPKVVGGFFQALGGWISSPFTHLGAWMGYAVWVLLFAKLFGGLGGVKRFLGLTALYAVPNLLGFFNFIPFIGWLIALIGAIWGWVIYFKGVSVSQEFTTGKAILITILPVVLVIVLSFIFAALSVMGLISAFGNS